MQRREFITLIGGTAFAWPQAVFAQQSDKPRLIGVLMGFASDDPEARNRFTAFRDAFQGLGWSEGRNVRIETRWTGANYERLKDYAAELVALAPDVLVCGAVAPVKELSHLTRTIPIVFAGVSDPVGGGVVTSLARPGGNVTGFSSFEPDMGGKWLQLLKEIAPSVSRVTVLFQPEIGAQAQTYRNAVAAAPSLGVEVRAAGMHDANEIELVIATTASQSNGGLVFIQSGILNVNRDLIVDLAARHRLPAIYPFREFATSGGLLYYGYEQMLPWRGAAGYVDRVLKSEKPGDLPVQAPTKFELVINLKTAKALGLNVPNTLIGRADEVIE
jgi:putative ABC transport system substrate-binding protein